MSKLDVLPRAHRLRARWRILRNHGEELSKRAAVEVVLLDVASGKRPMLTRDECRELAYRLGMSSADYAKRGEGNAKG
jgi:hypothetical protein